MKEEKSDVWVVSYNREDGAFWIRPDTGLVSRYVDVCKGNTLLTHSFVDWASKHFNLSNQPDKPVGYIGNKPSYQEVLNASDTFLEIFTAIEARATLLV